MRAIDLITTDNVIHMATYKMMKQAMTRLPQVKNEYLAMNEEQRAAFRLSVAEKKAEAPLSLANYIRERAYKEVENE